MDMVDMDIGHGIHGHGGHGHDVHGHGGHGFICQFWVQVCCSEMFYSAFLPFFAAKRACGSNFQEFCLNDDVKIYFFTGHGHGVNGHGGHGHDGHGHDGHGGQILFTEF